MTSRTKRFAVDAEGLVHAVERNLARRPELLHDPQFIQFCCEIDEQGTFLGESIAGSTCPFEGLRWTDDQPNCLGCCLRRQFWPDEEDQ